MTTPAPSGPAKRSKRLYVYWGVALTLLLTLGAFCWLVVVPVWRTKTSIEEQTAKLEARYAIYSPYGPGLEGYKAELDFCRREAQTAVAALGGPERAAQGLEEYLRLPSMVAGDRVYAVTLLYYCGAPGVAKIVALLDDGDPAVREHSAIMLVLIGAPCDDKVRSVLEPICKNADWFASRTAAEALKKIRKKEKAP